MTGIFILCLPRLVFLCYNCVKVERKLANQTISVHRRRYAVGLFWQPVSLGNTGRAAARRLAHSIDGRYSLYAEYNFMIGLSMRHVGHKSGMPSAAAEILEAMSEFSSFLAVFSVEQGFYMVAVRNGIILVDNIFDKEEDARAEYTKLSQMPDWGAFIAPSKWGMPRAVEHNIEDVITGHSRAVLRSISLLRSVILSVVLVALFVFAIILLYRDPVVTSAVGRKNLEKIDEQKVEEYRKQIEEKNKELDKQFQIEKKPEPEPIVPPYNLLPDVQARAEICYKAMAFLMQPISGWNQVSVKCDESHATAQLRRTYGTIGDFYSVANELMPGVFVQEVSEDVLTLRAKLPTLKAVPSQDKNDTDTIVRDVTTAFQSIDADANIQTVVDTITNGIETQTFDVVEVAASSKLTPMQFMQIFDNFGGVYMTSCDWKAASRTWNYEVIIYAK